MDEETKAKFRELRQKMEKLILEYAELRNQDEEPIMIGWAVAYEWTSVNIERADRYAIGTITADSQAGSMTRGLLINGSEHFSGLRPESPED